MSEENTNNERPLNLDGPIQFARLRAVCSALQEAARVPENRNNTQRCLQWIVNNRNRFTNLPHLPSSVAEMNTLLSHAQSINRVDGNGNSLPPRPRDVDHAKGVYDRVLGERVDKAAEDKEKTRETLSGLKKQRRGLKTKRFFARLGWVGALALSIGGIFAGGALVSGALGALAAGASLTSGATLAVAGLGILAAKLVIKGISGLFKKFTGDIKSCNQQLKDTKQAYLDAKEADQRASENQRIVNNIMTQNRQFDYSNVPDFSRESYYRGLGPDQAARYNAAVPTRVLDEEEYNSQVVPVEVVEEVVPEEARPVEVVEEVVPEEARPVEVVEEVIPEEARPAGDSNDGDDSDGDKDEDDKSKADDGPKPSVNFVPVDELEMILQKLNNGEELTSDEEAFFVENDSYQEIKQNVIDAKVEAREAQEMNDLYVAEKAEIQRKIEEKQNELDAQKAILTGYKQAADKEGLTTKDPNDYYTTKDARLMAKGIPSKSQLKADRDKHEALGKEIKELSRQRAELEEHFGKPSDANDKLQKALNAQKEFIQDEIAVSTVKEAAGKATDKKTTEKPKAYRAESTYEKLQKEVAEYNKAIEDFNAGRLTYQQLSKTPVGKSTFEKVLTESGPKSLGYRIAQHNLNVTGNKFKILNKSILEKPKGRREGLQNQISKAKKELTTPKENAKITPFYGNLTVGNVSGLDAKFVTGSAELDAIFKGKSFGDCQKIIDLLNGDAASKEKAKKYFDDKVYDANFVKNINLKWQEFKKANNIVIVNCRGEDVALQFNPQRVKDSSKEELKGDIMKAANIQDSNQIRQDGENNLEETAEGVGRNSGNPTYAAQDSGIINKEDSNSDPKNKDGSVFGTAKGIVDEITGGGIDLTGEEKAKKTYTAPALEVVKDVIIPDFTKLSFDVSSVKNLGYLGYLLSNNLPVGATAWNGYRQLSKAEKEKCKLIANAYLESDNTAVTKPENKNSDGNKTAKGDGSAKKSGTNNTAGTKKKKGEKTITYKDLSSEELQIIADDVESSQEMNPDDAKLFAGNKKFVAIEAELQEELSKNWTTPEEKSAGNAKIKELLEKRKAFFETEIKRKQESEAYAEYKEEAKKKNPELADAEIRAQYNKEKAAKKVKAKENEAAKEVPVKEQKGKAEDIAAAEDQNGNSDSSKRNSEIDKKKVPIKHKDRKKKSNYSKKEKVEEQLNEVPPIPEVTELDPSTKINESGEIIRDQKTEDNKAPSVTGVTKEEIEAAQNAELQEKQAEKQKEQAEKNVEKSEQKIVEKEEPVQAEQNNELEDEELEQRPTITAPTQEEIEAARFKEKYDNLPDLTNPNKPVNVDEQGVEEGQKTAAEDEFRQFLRSKGTNIQDPKEVVKAQEDFEKRKKDKGGRGNVNVVDEQQW